MSSPATCRHADLNERIAAQRQVIARFETTLWEGGFNDKLLPYYQAAWRRLEELIAACPEPDRRHGFLLILPVADSPRHLRACLASVLDLCRAYGYGGRTAEGHWRKVAVLLADDSAQPEARLTHQAIADEVARQGLRIHYFGPQEQMDLLDRLSQQAPTLDLAPIIGQHARPAFAHKGQAMMRNIAYLQAADLQAQEEALQGGPLLCYTLDADQAFQVKVATAAGDAQVAAVSFLHQLDAIFQNPALQVLTGKVVGDPPVSPAVMAGNFLDDVIGFLGEMAHTRPDLPYPRHIASTRGSGEAAYHDMADLFGFKAGGEVYRYRCALPGEPGNAACFDDFSRRLNSFFHGEHPTRVTYYRHEAPLSTPPARTVYTGNYCFRPQVADGFIPYAPLRLRMSGPAMGRLLKAELGAGFVSANLPMLHRRTLEETGQSEFRPGVVEQDQGVDLSDEFERQFHGDVLLFTLERLTAQGYPDRPQSEADILAALDATRADLRQRYRTRQVALLERLDQLEALLTAPEHWWNRATDEAPDLAEATARFHAFTANLHRNFGPDASSQQRLDQPGVWEQWRSRQVAAIAGLPAQRHTWAQAMARLAPGA